MNFRERINEETLSLRKNRHKQDLLSRRCFLLNEKSRHLICPFKLKGIPEETLEKFRINDNNLEESLQKTISFLNSKELDDVKFGSFLLRIYFSKIIEQEEKLNKINKKLDYHIDIFIEKGIIPLIGKILNNETNLDVLSELTWALINLTCFDTKEKGFEYIKDFINPTYMKVYYKLVNLGDNEIIIHLYNFLVNCIVESEDFAKSLFFSDENFIRLCIKKYLEPTKSIAIDQDAKKATIIFFVSLSRLSNLLNEKQKYTFYKIYEKILGFKQLEIETLNNAILGLRYLFCLDKSETKTIFNIIKKNNYDIFDKFFFALNEIISEDENIEEIQIIIFSISSFIQNFILLAEEKDIVILLKQTQLLNFIEAFYPKIFFQNVKNSLIEVLVLLSQHNFNIVIIMVKGRDNLLHNIIKDLLNSNSFDIRAKGIEIVFNMLNLNVVDINIALFKTEIIDQLITINLFNEEEPQCLKNILNGILFFINNLKCLEKQWKIDIINNLLKIGISNSLENKCIRFKEEHNLIINQIKCDIETILEDDEKNNSEKNINNSNFYINGEKNNENENNN